MTKELSPKISDNYKEYNFVLERDNGADDCFNEFFIGTPSKLFKIPEREKDVLSFYRKCLNRIPNSEINKNIIKYGENFYSGGHGTSFPNSSYDKRINIDIVTKINFDYWNHKAVKNLLDFVEDDNLSLGDKKIIKDIAIKSFKSMVEFASEIKGIGFSECLTASLHETAINELRSYGFGIKSRKNFKDIELI